MKALSKKCNGNISKSICVSCVATIAFVASGIINAHGTDEAMAVAESDRGRIYSLKTNERTFKLFIPKDRKEIRGIMFSAPGLRSTTIKIVSSNGWQDVATVFGYGLLAWDNGAVIPDEIINALNIFTKDYEIPCVATAPICALGFSAGGGSSWSLVKDIPERIIFYTVNKGKSSTGNIEGKGLQVPGINLRGERESEEQMSNQERLFVENRVRGALLSFAVDEGAKHVTGDVYEQLAIPYLWAIENQRNPNGALPLSSFSEKDGWLADPDTRHSPMMKIYEYDKYPADKDKRKAHWLANKDIAYVFSAFSTAGKKLYLKQAGKKISSSALSFIVSFEEGFLQANPIEKLEFYDYSRKFSELKASGREDSFMFHPDNLNVGVHSFIAIAFCKNGEAYISNPHSITTMHNQLDQVEKHEKQ